MKKSIYLQSKLLQIMMRKLDAEQIEYEIKPQEHGGTLLIDKKDIPTCSGILENARIEEAKLRERLYSLECELVNKNRQDISNVPHFSLVEEIAVVPLNEDGLFVDQKYCESVFMTPDELLDEVAAQLKRANFLLERMDVLLRRLMESMNFDVDYVDETIRMYGSGCPIWLLHNYPKPYGATSIFTKEILQYVTIILKENFYVLLSTKHEAVLIPESYVPSLPELDEMLRDVHNAELDQDEILTDSIFYFNGSELVKAQEPQGIEKIPGRDIRQYTEIYSILIRLRDVNDRATQIR